MFYLNLVFIAVADPGFSRGGGGRQLPKWVGLSIIFAENCMKMKESGPGGGAHPWRPLRSTNVHSTLGTSALIFIQLQFSVNRI